ncbi:poly(U)-specific 3'-to-5' RNA exonuclease [Halocaridina rubra]|uniref:U6 snRNA phosphodiesterase n=1 Tax=Halocaridina rubra TaxID=373956 RepID=A0AAN8X1T5_HALRR
MATGRRKGALSLLQSYGSDASDSDEDSGYTSEDEKKRKQEFNSPHETVKKRRKADEEEDMVVDGHQPQFPSPQSHICSSVSTSATAALETVTMRDEHLHSHEQSSHMDTTSPPPTETDLCAIPLPHELCVAKEIHEDNPSQHQGRIRSFAHERGNWASILYVPLHLGVYGASFASLLASLVATCQENDVKLTPSTQLHISLTRTLVLQLHWIEPLVATLRERLGKFLKFSMWLHGLSVYVNEEKTRTFLGLRVCHGRNELDDIVSQVNVCIDEYRLPPFYKDGSYHASVAWCTGDVSEALRRLLPALENICSQYFSVESDMRTFDIHSLIFKTGNRHHTVHLKTGN